MKNINAQKLGRLRWKNISKKERSEYAKKNAELRWLKQRIDTQTNNIAKTETVDN